MKTVESCDRREERRDGRTDVRVDTQMILGLRNYSRLWKLHEK